MFFNYRFDKLNKIVVFVYRNRKVIVVFIYINCINLYEILKKIK